MNKYIVIAPNPDYTGEVAGVPLVKGRYDGPLSASALAYFQGAGYGVAEVEPAEPAPDPAEESKPRFERLPGSPSRAASKHDWVVFASQGAPEGLRITSEQAEALTRDQLAEKYLGPKED